MSEVWRGGGSKGALERLAGVQKRPLRLPGSADYNDKAHACRCRKTSCTIAVLCSAAWTSFAELFLSCRHTSIACKCDHSPRAWQEATFSSRSLAARFSSSGSPLVGAETAHHGQWRLQRSLVQQRAPSGCRCLSAALASEQTHAWSAGQDSRVPARTLPGLQVLTSGADQQENERSAHDPEWVSARTSNHARLGWMFTHCWLEHS